MGTSALATNHANSTKSRSQTLGSWAAGCAAAGGCLPTACPPGRAQQARHHLGWCQQRRSPACKQAGGLGCISPGCLYLRATGITPGPTATGLCQHPAWGTGRGQGTALLWAADPSLGWPMQDPWGSFAGAGHPGLPPRQEQAGFLLPLHRAWLTQSNEEVPGAWQVPLTPWLGPWGAAWPCSGCPTAGREVKDPLGEGMGAPQQQWG